MALGLDFRMVKTERHSISSHGHGSGREPSMSLWIRERRPHIREAEDRSHGSGRATSPSLQENPVRQPIGTWWGSENRSQTHRLVHKVVKCRPARDPMASRRRGYMPIATNGIYALLDTMQSASETD
jgi:hypothetical protein